MSLFTNPVFTRNNKLGTDACEILSHAIQAVDPYTCVTRLVSLDHQQLNLGKHNLSLKQFTRIFLIGFGKAAVPMAKAVIDILGEKLCQAEVITKDKQFLSECGYQNILKVYLGGHPIPTEDSVQSTRTIFSNLPDLNENDLVLVVISGGGSALFSDPVAGVTLEDIQIMTKILIKCGADINEINTIRKHLDQVKGGQLAIKLQPAHIETLILSDVVGDHLDIIASGPTVPDPSTFQDVYNIFSKYNLLDLVPPGILRHFEQGNLGVITETLKPGQLSANRVRNHMVGNNQLAAQAAFQHALSLGYHAVIISTAVGGHSEYVAEFIAGILHTVLLHAHPVPRPACIIFGGEPTVVVTGDGLGGRNMDLALRLVPRIAGKHGVLFISLATDGEDGPTDAAGAVIDGDVFRDAQDELGLDFASYMTNNDSYHYFAQVGGLIKTGATGTNVNDLMLLMLD